MGHELGATRRAKIGDGVRARRQAPVDPRVAMAHALGNARFTALVESPGSGRPLRRSGAGVLARHLDAPLPVQLGAGNAPITVAAVRKFKEAIEVGWAALMGDSIQIAQITDFDAVQDRINAADAAYTRLVAAALIVNPGDPDAASLT